MSTTPRFLSERERWSSGWAFLAASVGCAIGLGNLVLFPETVFRYGGGVFFIPYFLAMFFLGIPMLIMEIGLGQILQGGVVLCFGRIHKRLRLIGVCCIWCSFICISYYVPLIAFFVRMFILSVQSKEDGTGTLWEGDDYKYSDDGVFSWVVSHVFGGLDNDGIMAQTPTHMILHNVYCLIFVYFSIWLAVYHGVRVQGFFAYVCVLLPVVLIVMIFAKSLTLDGSNFGASNFLGNGDFSKLVTQPEIWSEAASQIFFSLTITTGTMYAYGSYNDLKCNVARYSYFIALFDVMYCILAGFAVFCGLAQLSYIKAEKLIEQQMHPPFFDNVEDACSSCFPLIPHDIIFRDLHHSSSDPLPINEPSAQGEYARSFEQQKGSSLHGHVDERSYTSWSQWREKFCEGCTKESANNSGGSDALIRFKNSLRPNATKDSNFPPHPCVKNYNFTCLTIHSLFTTVTYPFNLPFFDTSEDHRFIPHKYYEWFNETAGEKTELYADDIIHKFPISRRTLQPQVLSFGAYPVLLSTVSSNPQFWNALFFAALYFLGVDSAFALLEAVVTVLLDTRIFKNRSRKTLSTGVCIVGFFFSLPYCTDAGLHLLAIVNRKLYDGMLVAGLFEVFTVGWIFRHAETVRKCGDFTPKMLIASVFFPTILFSTSLFSASEITECWVVLISCVFLVVAMLTTTIWLQLSRGDVNVSKFERVEYLLFGNVEYLRKYLNNGFLTDAKTARWYSGVPKYIWSFNIKFVCPTALIVMISNSMISAMDQSKPEVSGQYVSLKNNDHWWVYQVVCYMTTFLGHLLAILGFCISPDYFDFLVASNSTEEEQLSVYDIDVQ